jgi:hypothetical protein
MRLLLAFRPTYRVKRRLNGILSLSLNICKFVRNFNTLFVHERNAALTDFKWWPETLRIPAGISGAPSELRNLYNVHWDEKILTKGKHVEFHDLFQNITIGLSFVWRAWKDHENLKSRKSVTKPRFKPIPPVHKFRAPRVYPPISKMHVREICYKDINWPELAQIRPMAGLCKDGSSSVIGRDCLEQWITVDC